jgi:hypothetical protein
VLVTQDFLTRDGFVFLTGAVFNDTVINDDFYTPNEGIDDVTITATPLAGGTPFTTTTYGSGGYALQLADGLYRVKATGPFGTTPERLVQIAGKNIKLDVVDGAIVVVSPNGSTPGDIAGRVNGAWWVAKSTGTEFVNEAWGNWSTAVTWQDVQVADVNSDGLDDIAGRANGNWWVAKSTGTGFVNELWGNWSTAVTWVDVHAGNF